MFEPRFLYVAMFSVIAKLRVAAKIHCNYKNIGICRRSYVVNYMPWFNPRIQDSCEIYRIKEWMQIYYTKSSGFEF